MKRVRPLTRVLVAGLFATLLLGGATPQSKRQERLDKKGWKQVESKVLSGDPKQIMETAQGYLATFPEGRNRLRAHRLAGLAAMELEMWPGCHHHLDAYLKEGGRADVHDISLRSTLCLARQGASAAALPALKNIAANDENDGRAADAARELIALYLAEEQWAAALEAEDLLLTRQLYAVDLDLTAGQLAAKAMTEEQLIDLESALRGQPAAGTVAFLLLERRGQLVESQDTAKARRRFVARYADHPLFAMVPGAADFLGADDSDRTVLGVLLPLTGRYRSPAVLALQGIQQAIGEAKLWDSAGLEALRLEVFDTEGDPQRAAEGLVSLIEDHRAIAVLGPIVSAEADAAAQAAGDLSAPLLMMTQKQGLADAHPSVFNNWVDSQAQVEALVEHLLERMGTQRLAIVYPARPTAAAQADQFWTQFEAGGGTVTAIESYEPGQTDFRETARRLLRRHYLEMPPAETDPILPFLPHRLKPQLAVVEEELVAGVDFSAVFLADGFKSATMLAPGFLYERINLGGHLSEKQGMPVSLVGGSAFNHPDLIDRGGRYAEGTVFTDGFFPTSHAPPVSRFVTSYMEAHEQQPLALDASAYDSAHILCKALATGVDSRAELIGQLRMSEFTDSVLRSVGFGLDGEMDHDLVILGVEKQAFVQLHPAPTPPPPEELPPLREVKLAPDGTLVPADEPDSPSNSPEPVAD